MMGKNILLALLALFLCACTAYNKNSQAKDKRKITLTKDSMVIDLGVFSFADTTYTIDKIDTFFLSKLQSKKLYYIFTLQNELKDSFALHYIQANSRGIIENKDSGSFLHYKQKKRVWVSVSSSPLGLGSLLFGFIGKNRKEKKEKTLIIRMLRVIL